MRVRIEFPEDVAQAKAEEAREWEPGTPMVWEAEDINTAETIKKERDKIIVKSAHLKVELTKEEVAKIIEAYQHG